VPNPEGTAEVYFSLAIRQPERQRSRLQSHVRSLRADGKSLKFDQMGGTKMACDVRMELEQRFLAMFEFVAGWKIAGNSLQLVDSAGSTVAGFEASAEKP